ncbi:uncharacterized protein LOC131936418 [Physella acuta]|uniref:uncharacterized protein LOC131936418 n=1 Tax=Physella acuta TaxID=109671 RepID=UPI0027DE808A|nr:uncharacterized protein LOC131936418 [Physella acuta]
MFLICSTAICLVALLLPASVEASKNAINETDPADDSNTTEPSNNQNLTEVTNTTAVTTTATDTRSSSDIPHTTSTVTTTVSTGTELNQITSSDWTEPETSSTIQTVSINIPIVTHTSSTLHNNSYAPHYYLRYAIPLGVVGLMSLYILILVCFLTRRIRKQMKAPMPHRVSRLLDIEEDAKPKRRISVAQAHSFTGKRQRHSFYVPQT